MAPKTLLGPFRPILAYFLGGPGLEIFLSPFGSKKAKKNFPKKFLHYFNSQRVWDPQNPKIDPVDPPVDPILAHFVCKKAKFGVKKHVFLKNVFSYKMTFRGSSYHFSLGSKWFWSLQNDKMYTLGPSESPNGVRKGPRRAKNGPQNPTAPLRAYFSLFWGGGPKLF